MKEFTNLLFEVPFADPIKVTVRSSVPVSSPTRTSRVLRSSTRRMSTDPVAETSITQEINKSSELFIQLQ